LNSRLKADVDIMGLVSLREIFFTDDASVKK